MKSYEIELEVSQEDIDRAHAELANNDGKGRAQLCPMAQALSRHFGFPCSWICFTGYSCSKEFGFRYEAIRIPKVVQDFDNQLPCSPCKVSILVVDRSDQFVA